MDDEVGKEWRRKRANAVTLGNCPLHRLHQLRVVAARGAVVLLEDSGGAVAVEQEVGAVRDGVNATLQLQQKFGVLRLMPQVHKDRFGPHCPGGRPSSRASAPHLGRGLRGRANWDEGRFIRETPHAALGDAGGEVRQQLVSALGVEAVSRAENRPVARRQGSREICALLGDAVLPRSPQRAGSEIWVPHNW